MRRNFPAFLFLLCFQSGFGQNFATQFSGSDYVSCGSSISNSIASANKLTLETRFRMTTTPGSWDAPCGTYHSGSWLDGGFGFFSNGNAMRFFIYDYSANVASAPFDNSNTAWHHLAGTWDQSTGAMAIYFDGVSFGTDTYTGTIGLITNDIFHIGAAIISYNWKGQLDEVRVWNVVRTQAQIQASMNTQLVGNETGLIAYYKMEEGIGTSLTDNSGNGNTGTMTAGVTWVGAPTVSSVSPMSATRLDVAKP
ncbi:MAG: LamG domain-containing protein [Bacteroidota bacterium]